MSPQESARSFRLLSSRQSGMLGSPSRRSLIFRMQYARTAGGISSWKPSYAGTPPCQGIELWPEPVLASLPGIVEHHRFAHFAVQRLSKMALYFAEHAWLYCDHGHLAQRLKCTALQYHVEDMEAIPKNRYEQPRRACRERPHCLQIARWRILARRSCLAEFAQS